MSETLDGPLWVVILAGGIGSRFWPLSTPERPKQLLPLVNDAPLLVNTVDRLRALVGPDQTLILTNASIQREIAAVLPGHKLEPIPLDHPLYHAHYDIAKVEYTPRVAEDFGAMSAPSLSGITLDGRLAVVFSRFDLSNGWEQFPHPYTYGYSDKDALAIGTNVIVTAVTH